MTAEKIFEFDVTLLEILACPLTKQPLKFNEITNELISEAAGLAFPIIDGIPVLLTDHARKL
ncbi:MAG: Trm112 family protein [Sphingobacteriia bacterium]|nr:Trm112 family protein [Sphingobacteriia bacterium]